MSPTTQTPPRDWPLWWFARLEYALESGNCAAAKEALQNLSRLGIEVKFGLPPGRRSTTQVEAQPAGEEARHV